MGVQGAFRCFGAAGDDIHRRPLETHLQEHILGGPQDVFTQFIASSGHTGISPIASGLTMSKRYGIVYLSRRYRTVYFLTLAREAAMIVVTTPTGSIGRQVLENILDGGQSIRVIARDPSGLPRQVLDRVDVVEGSHGNIDVVNKAFAGADSVFWLCPPNPRAESVEAAYVDFTRPAADAIRSKGVKRVVAVSALGRGTAMARNAGYVTASLK